MIYLFNENFSLDSSYDRFQLHKIIDDIYYLTIIETDEGLEVNNPEYINLDDLEFNHDLDIHDFDLIDVTVEELEEEREELHTLISKRDKKGLQSFYSSLPLEFKGEDKVSMVELLNSGRLEEIVIDYIVDNYNGFYVEHSRSVVASNSFYIKDEDENVVIKISDHNTIFQQVEHGNNPFINPVGEYGIEMTVEEVLKKIDQHLEIYKEER